MPQISLKNWLVLLTMFIFLLISVISKLYPISNIKNINKVSNLNPSTSKTWLW